MAMALLKELHIHPYHWVSLCTYKDVAETVRVVCVWYLKSAPVDMAVDFELTFKHYLIHCKCDYEQFFKIRNDITSSDNYK